MQCPRPPNPQRSMLVQHHCLDTYLSNGLCWFGLCGDFGKRLECAPPPLGRSRRARSVARVRLSWSCTHTAHADITAESPHSRPGAGAYLPRIAAFRQTSVLIAPPARRRRRARGRQRAGCGGLCVVHLSRAECTGARPGASGGSRQMQGLGNAITALLNAPDPFQTYSMP